MVGNLKQSLSIETSLTNHKMRIKIKKNSNYFLYEEKLQKKYMIHLWPDYFLIKLYTKY